MNGKSNSFLHVQYYRHPLSGYHCSVYIAEVSRQYGSQGYRQHASFIINSAGTEGREREDLEQEISGCIAHLTLLPLHHALVKWYITGRSRTCPWVLGRAWVGLGSGWAVCQLINMIISHLYLARCHLCKQSHCHTKDFRSKPTSYIIDVHDINGSFNCIPNSLFRLETVPMLFISRFRALQYIFPPVIKNSFYSQCCLIYPK